MIWKVIFKRKTRVQTAFVLVRISEPSQSAVIPVTIWQQDMLETVFACESLLNIWGICSHHLVLKLLRALADSLVGHTLNAAQTAVLLRLVESLQVSVVVPFWCFCGE